MSTTAQTSPPLAGKVALVTGATQGIGLAIARRLSADGACVAVNDRQAGAGIDGVVKEIRGIAAPADVSRRDEIQAMVADVEEHVGQPIDILVANAAYMSMGPLTEHDPADWWRVIDTNLSGTFHLSQAVLPGMRRAGGGRIVIMASYWGLCGWPDATAYAASKAGLVSLAKTLGRELAPENIIVNAVAPGVIDTPQLQVDAADAGVSLDEIRHRYAQAVPLGRIGQPEEIAGAVAMLADPTLGAMVGQIVQVNGGELRGRA